MRDNIGFDYTRIKVKDQKKKIETFSSDSSITKWEDSYFGGYYRTVMDYPEVKIHDNVDFEVGYLANGMSFYTREKILKILLSKVKTNELTDTLLNKCKVTRTRNNWGEPILKAVVANESKMHVIENLKHCEKEFSPMFSHYQKFILDSEIFFFFKDPEESQSSGEGNDDSKEKEEKEEKEKEKENQKSSGSSKGKKKEKEEKEKENSGGGSGSNQEEKEKKEEQEKQEKNEGSGKSEEEKEKEEEKENKGDSEKEEKEEEKEEKSEEEKQKEKEEQEKQEKEEQDRLDERQKEIEEKEKKRQEELEKPLRKPTMEEVHQILDSFEEALNSTVEEKVVFSYLSGFDEATAIYIENENRTETKVDGKDIRAAENLVKMLDISFDPEKDTVKNLRIGKLDVNKIAEVPAGNIAIYKQDLENQTTRPFSIAILCDESGSMGSGHYYDYGDDDGEGDKLFYQHKIVKQLYLAFSEILPQNKIYVYGHSGHACPELYVYHDPYRPNFMKTIDNMLSNNHGRHQSNYDGPIIEEVYKAVRNSTEDRIIFIVLSDGQPAGRSYGGRDDKIKMRQIIEKCKRDEFVTIGVGIQHLTETGLYQYSTIVKDLEEMEKKVSHIINHVVKTEFQ